MTESSVAELRDIIINGDLEVQLARDDRATIEDVVTNDFDCLFTAKQMTLAIRQAKQDPYIATMIKKLGR